MLSAQDKQQLAQQYGGAVQEALSGLIALAGGLISQRDTIGLCFLLETASGVIQAAAAEGAKVQSKRRELN